MTGLTPDEAADLDEDEFRALVDAVHEREQARSWTNVNEGIATAVEALWAIIARLEAGVPVVQVAKTRKPHDYGRYPRPPWLKGDARRGGDEIVVTSMRDAVRALKGESHGR